MSDEVVYRSNVQVARIKGPHRWAKIPAEDEPIQLSIHSGIAEHYKMDPDSLPRHAATLDYVVAAAAG